MKIWHGWALVYGAGLLVTAFFPKVGTWICGLAGPFAILHIKAAFTSRKPDHEHFTS